MFHVKQGENLDMNTPTAADYAQGEPDPSAPTPLSAQALDHVDMVRRVENVRTFKEPTKTRVFVVANQKGGVGKTTTSVNLAAAMASRGLQILLVDLDPQGNASTAAGIPHASGTPGIYEVLLDGASIESVVQFSPDVPNLAVVPATIDLAGAEIELVMAVNRERKLRSAIDSYLETEAGAEIDYVFVDCPPSLGLLTVNAMVAAREVLIPIQCEYYALEGLSQLLRNIELVQEHLNEDLDVSTILLTMHDARTNLSSSVASEVRAHFGERVLNTAIPRSVRISEAPGYQQSIITYDPNSTGALSYFEAAREITEAGE
jgi:chromosome partitioning protein